MTIPLRPTFYGLLCFAVGKQSINENIVRPELHLNIWENGNAVHLDIGVMLDIKEEVTKLEFFLPWLPVGQEDGEPKDVEDLHRRIDKEDAIPAIFNESWSITRIPRKSGLVISEPTTNAVLFTVVDIDGALNARKYQVSAHVLSLDIAQLRTKSNGLSSSSPKFYVRFRIRSVPKSFYCVGIAQRDRWWVSSSQRTEIIDFRLNVRRGVPADLERSIGPFVDFSKVHLFLMKSREQDIVFEDTLFKSCRSLEDEEFWAGYSSDGTEADKRNSLLNVKQSLGYQWSKKGGPDNKALVKEFGILARFKKVEFGIGKFLVWVLILGALGNALWDGIKFGYDKYAGETKHSEQECALMSQLSCGVPKPVIPQGGVKK